MNLRKNVGKVFISKFVGAGPLCYKKRIYLAAVSQRLRNSDMHVDEPQSIAVL